MKENRVAHPQLLMTKRYRPCRTGRLDRLALTARVSHAHDALHEPLGLTVGVRAASVVQTLRAAAAALGAHVCAAGTAALAAAVGDAARGAAHCLCATPHAAREGRDAPD